MYLVCVYRTAPATPGLLKSQYRNWGSFVLIRVNFSHMSGPKTKAVWTAKHRPMRRLFVGHISTYRVDTPYSSFRKHKHINRRTTPVQWKHVSLIDLLAQRVCRVGSSGLLVPDLVFAVPELVGSVIADLVVPGEQRECSAGPSSMPPNISRSVFFDLSQS